MRLPPMLPGVLLRRYKRFLADVRLDDGRVITASCPNTGSMKTCAEPGSACYVSVSASPTRKYPHTLELVRSGRVLVCVNTMLPNRVVREAIEAGRIAELTGYPVLRGEVPYGTGSRIDLLLEDGPRRCYVEVKGVSMVRGGRAEFPDAVTARGLKHIGELERVVAEGHRGVLLFLVQRADGGSFGVADDLDPAYGEALRRARERGVEVLPYRARVRRDSIRLTTRLPVDL